MNTLNLLGNEHNFAAEISLQKGSWQRIELSPDAFRNVNGEVLSSFTSVKELELSPKEVLKQPRGVSGDPFTLGGNWNGESPDFRKLRWVKN